VCGFFTVAVDITRMISDYGYPTVSSLHIIRYKKYHHLVLLPCVRIPQFTTRECRRVHVCGPPKDHCLARSPRDMLTNSLQRHLMNRLHSHLHWALESHYPLQRQQATKGRIQGASQSLVMRICWLVKILKYLHRNNTWLVDIFIRFVY